MKKIFSFFLFLILYPLFSVNIKASNTTISNLPAEINIAEEYPYNLSLTGLAPNNPYRVRIALSKEGEEMYFGEIFNAARWYGADSDLDPRHFFGILTDGNGVWAGTIKGRINYQNANFDNTLGSYQVNILTYYENGEFFEKNPVGIIKLNDPNPPPLIPTAFPTNTPVPTVNIIAPTEVTPTSILVISPSLVTSLSPKNITPVDLSSDQKKSEVNGAVFFFIWFFTSIILIIVVLYLWSKKHKRI